MPASKTVNPLYANKLVHNCTNKGLDGTKIFNWGATKPGQDYCSPLNPQYDRPNDCVARFSRPVALALLYMAASQAGYSRAALRRENADPLPIPRFTIALNQTTVSNEVYTSEQPVLDSQGQETGTFILARCATNGIWEAVQYSEKGLWLPLAKTNDEAVLKHPMEGIYAMFLQRIFAENAQARDDYASIQAGLDYTAVKPKSSNDPDVIIDTPDLLAPHFFRICDAFNSAPLGPTPLLKVKSLAGNNIPTIAEQSINNGVLQGTIVVGQQPTLLFGKDSAEQVKKNMTVADAKRYFAAFRDKQNWTEAEQEFIPQFDDNFPVPPEVMDIANLYTKTQDSKRPMVNFLWRGITSYGKSTGVEVLASILNLPLLRMTCNSNMETQEFLSNYVPDNGDAGLDMSDLPSFEDISMDPEGAYAALTGTSLSGATPQDCLEAYAAVCAEKKGKNVARYKIVESNFVKALQYGYLCEVQEISRIRDAGVMVGINEYDRPGAHIPMVDGSFAVRVPQALVVYTDNVGYASCRPIDPSVIRRMAYVIDSYELPKEKVIDRVIYNTGFEDKTLLLDMYDTWKKIADYCADQEITEGSVSVTELEMWAQAVMVTGGHVADNCKRCVIAKATSVPEEQKEIEATILSTSNFD